MVFLFFFVLCAVLCLSGGVCVSGLVVVSVAVGAVVWFVCCVFFPLYSW